MSAAVIHKGASTREAILEHARQCLLIQGYKKMTMEDVAQAAGISRAALYLHFTNKQDLAIAVIDHSSRTIQCELREIARGKGSPSKRVVEILRTRVVRKHEHCMCASQSIDELLAAIRQPLLHLRNVHIRTESEILAEVLIEGRANGEFQFEDAVPTAEAFLTATYGLLPYALSTSELGDQETIMAKLDRIIAMCLRSIQTPEAFQADSARTGRRSGRNIPSNLS